MITGELRELADTFSNVWLEKDGSVTYTTGTSAPSLESVNLEKRINHIADLIDSKHEKALTEMRDRAYNEGYGEGFASADDALSREENGMLAEHGFIRLPKDADGEHIRIGDVMENIVCPSVHREVTGVGVECFYGWDDGNGRYSQFDVNCYRHYHAPAVEDVLRELVRILAYCMSEDRDCDKCVLNGADMPIPQISACDSLSDRMRDLGVEVD